ncbi:MAG: M20/M25/M40 family metallo-hydrolase [Christensenellales bacterium]|jgi:putative aminopeptidase FrvX
MDKYSKFLELCGMAGLSGNESAVSNQVIKLFSNYTEKVWADGIYNTYGQMGETGPLVMIAAHIDEVGLMVKAIRDDGFLSICEVGGVDRRILPAQEVLVHGKELLPGIIAVKPPHVLTPDERKKSVSYDDLYVDIGHTGKRAKALVRVGDCISFKPQPSRLANGLLSTKSADDRMGVAIMLMAMKALQERPLPLRTVMTATTQEEVGSKGGQIAAQRLNPDLAIVLEVTHGDTPGAKPFTTQEMDKVNIAIGPILHKGYVDMLTSVAHKEKIPFTLEVFPRISSTDADEIQLSGWGVPCVIIQVPLRYMHTTVETISWPVMEQASKLLIAFLLAFSETEV